MKPSWDSSRWGWILSLAVIAVSAVWSQASKMAAIEAQLQAREKEIDRTHIRIDRLENKPCK